MAFGMEVHVGPVHIVLDEDTAPLPEKGAESTQFSANLYCGQTVGCIKMPLGMDAGLSPGDFVLDGDPVPPQKGGGAPKFSAHVYCGQTAGWIKMPLGTKVGLSPGDCVLDGDPAPSQKGGGALSQFSAHFYCGQTAGCIKTPLGMEVGLSPVDFVLDGDPAPTPKGAEPHPILRPTSIVAKRLHGSRCHLVRR